MIDHPGEWPDGVDGAEAALLVDNGLAVDDEADLQVCPIEASPVRDRLAHDQGVVHLVVGQQPFGIDLLEVREPRVDDFHADESISHGSKRLFATDRLAAGCDVTHDMEGDLDLDADHVHRLAVEPAWRGNQRAGQQRRGIGFRRRRARADLPARDRTACLGHAILDGVDRTAIRQGEGWRHLKAAAPRFEQGAHRV